MNMFICLKKLKKETIEKSVDSLICTVLMKKQVQDWFTGIQTAQLSGWSLRISGAKYIWKEIMSFYLPPIWEKAGCGKPAAIWIFIKRACTHRWKLMNSFII